MEHSDLIDIYVTVHNGIDGQGGDTLQTEFLHDVLAVGDDGGQSDVKPIGNFLVDIALHNERHDLNFAVGENLLL